MTAGPWPHDTNPDDPDSRGPPRETALRLAIMRHDTQEWLAGLCDFATHQRLVRPPAAAEQPATERAAERSILAAHLVSWLDGFGTWTAARRIFAAGADADPEPAVVLTTSPVGIEAAESLCAVTGTPAALLRPQLACVTELEYRLWCIRHPDESFRRHVNHWSWLKRNVPTKREAEFAHHPLAEGEAYWLHRTGTAGAGGADRRDCHLWKWNGRHAALLQPFIRERGLVEPDDARDGRDRGGSD